MRTWSVLPALLVTLVLCAGANAAESRVYVEDKGLVVIEMESVLPAAGWEIRQDKAGYTGTGYGFFTGANAYGGASGSAIQLSILITTPGRYTMHFRCSNEGAERHDLNNDLWAQMDDGPTYKTFQASVDWKWGARFDHHPEGKPEAFYDLDPGLHTLTLRGRSHGFHVDRVVLFLPARKQAAHDLATPETLGVPPLPADLTNEQVRATWQAGQLGAVWKWAARKTNEPGAGTAIASLQAALDQDLADLPHRFASDPLAAVTTAEFLARRYDGSPRASEITSLIKDWKRAPRLRREVAAQGVVAKIHELQTDAARRSGTAKEQLEAQIAQGRAVLTRDYADTAVAKRFLGRP